MMSRYGNSTLKRPDLLIVSYGSIFIQFFNLTIFICTFLKLFKNAIMP